MPVKSSMIIPRPYHEDHNTISPWLDEQIWGHRILDSQSPWLLYLEFLNVAEACHREEKLLDEQNVYYPLTFRPYKRMNVRNILFNNEAIAQIDEQHSDSNMAWTVWLNWIGENAQVVQNRDFSYLKKRFHSFHDFAALVLMLRTSVVESDTNKRWTSRFIFPFGPNSLYEDLNITGGREYINFGRTGELLYLMLARSSRKAELIPHITGLVNSKNRWDSLLGLLQPAQDNDLSVRGKSYLPYREHKRFDELGLDWLKVFELQLPSFDAFLHLVILGSLHVFLYHLTIAAEWLGQAKDPYIICEVVAPRKTLVRELSFANYMENSSLSAKAIEAYITAIENSEEWQNATANYGAFTRCKQILEQLVWWPKNSDDYSGPTDPESLISELRATALKRHQQHVANVHRNYGRGVGLISKRGTNKLRYAPNDSLLKTLVFANVSTRMEFHEFLSVLYKRYGFIFGDREAEQVLPKDDLDKKAFQANARRLEQRLDTLGMLHRLSDACAYVENPYGQRLI